MVGTATNLLFLTSLPWAPVFVKGVFFNRGFRPDAGAALSPLTWVVQAFEASYGRSGMAGSPPGSTLYWGGMGVGLSLGGGLVGRAGGLLPALWHRSEAGGGRGGTRVAVSTPESVWERAEAPGRRWRGRSELFPCRWWAARGLEEGWVARSFRWAAVLVFVVMLWV